MKIISLNIWGGRAGQGVIDFAATKKDKVDIFCFQEIFNGGQNEQAEMDENIPDKQYDLFAKLQATLPEHDGYFQPCLGHWYGLAIFVRKNLSVNREEFRFVHGEPYIVPKDDLGYHPRIIQDLILDIAGQELHVINFHGLWNGKGKTDSEARIKQSQEILNYLSGISGNIILCGDFNLLPDTESLRMIESSGLRNLIKEFGITSTRTVRYTKPDKYADYVFVGVGVKVNEFKVLPDNVSDHAALELVIE